MQTLQCLPCTGNQVSTNASWRHSRAGQSIHRCAACGDFPLHPSCFKEFHDINRTHFGTMGDHAVVSEQTSPDWRRDKFDETFDEKYGLLLQWKDDPSYGKGFHCDITRRASVDGPAYAKEVGPWIHDQMKLFLGSKDIKKKKKHESQTLNDGQQMKLQTLITEGWWTGHLTKFEKMFPLLIKWRDEESQLYGQTGVTHCNVPGSVRRYRGRDLYTFVGYLRVQMRSMQMKEGKPDTGLELTLDQCHEVDALVSSGQFNIPGYKSSD